jgi:hypothetical protein
VRLRFVLSAIVGLALLAAVLRIRSEAHHARGVVTALREARPGWLLLAAALEAGSYVAPGIVLLRLCRDRLAGPAEAVQIAVAALGVGGILPGQPLPAGAIVFRELRRRDVAARRAAIVAVILLVAVPAGSMVVLAAPALVASGIAEPLPAGWSGTMLAAGGVATLLALAVCLSWPGRPRSRGRPTGSACAP